MVIFGDKALADENLGQRLAHFMLSTVEKSGRPRPQDQNKEDVEIDQLDPEDAQSGAALLPTANTYDPSKIYMRYCHGEVTVPGLGSNQASLDDRYTTLTTIRWDLLCLAKYSSSLLPAALTKLRNDLYCVAVTLNAYYHLRRPSKQHILLGRNETRMLIEDIVANTRTTSYDLICQDLAVYLTLHYTMARYV